MQASASSRAKGQQEEQQHQRQQDQVAADTELARLQDIVALLVRLTTLSLTLGLTQTALFLSERFSCLLPHNEEAAYLYALSLLRSGEHRQALELLRATLVDTANTASGFGLQGRKPACEASTRCAWIYSEACSFLGRPQEGSECLRRAFMIFGHAHGASSSKAPRHEAAGLPDPLTAAVSPITVNLSLAKLAAQANKPDVAAQKYFEVLKTAWWCWEAFEGLCRIGRASDTDSLYAPLDVPSLPAAPNTTARVGHGHPRRSHSPNDDEIAIEPPSSHIATTVTPGPSSTAPNTLTNGLLPAHRAPIKANGRPNPHIPSRLESSEADSRFAELGENGGIGAENNPIGLSMEDDSTGAGYRANETSDFFGGPDSQAAQNGRTGSSKGGLFNFARFSSDAQSKKLFGNGLFFGSGAAQATSSAVQNPGQPAASASGSALGSFFTPINAATKATAAPLETPLPAINGHATRNPPAAKRSRHQIDIDDSLPTFQLAQTETLANGVRNGHRITRRAGSATPSMADSEGFNESIHVDSGTADRLVEHGGAHLAQHNLTTDVKYAPRKAPSALSLAAARQASSRPPHPRHAHSTEHLKVDGHQRVSSNPRDRKRSKGLQMDTEGQTGPAMLSSSANEHTASSSPISNDGQYPQDVRGTAKPRSQLSAAMQATSSSSTSHNLYSSSRLQRSDSAQSDAKKQQRYRQHLEARRRALAENWLREMYRGFAQACSAMSSFDLATVTSSILALPVEQQRCSRATLLMARAHFEALHYDEAEKAFALTRTLAPYSAEGMELYSTLLWHLHRPTQLAFLAQELQALSPRLPQSWIATGNIFSHLEDHTNALKCFKRALQSDPGFTYAYTLAGHECVAMEEWDTAADFFREAIRREVRHYNAWFGLGNVYMKTGKYRLAEYHFRRATDLNPSNAMLICCVGTVLEKLKMKREALEMYERACLLAPTSPAVRFKRVRMLMDLRQYDAALRDLLIVRGLAPDEFNVHYLLGKLYGAIGDTANMTRSLTYAQDLEPRAAGRIREIIETSGRTDKDEDEEDQGEESVMAAENRGDDERMI